MAIPGNVAVSAGFCFASHGVSVCRPSRAAWSPIAAGWLLALTFVVALLTTPATAADLYWDTNAATANGDGGGKSWTSSNTSGTTWSTSSSGTLTTSAYGPYNGSIYTTVQFGFGPAPGNLTNGGTVGIGNSLQNTQAPSVGTIIFNASGTTGYTITNPVGNQYLQQITIFACGTNGASGSTFGQGTGIWVNANVTGNTVFSASRSGTGANAGNIGSVGVILGTGNQGWVNNSTTYGLYMNCPISGDSQLNTNGAGLIVFGGSNSFGSTLTVNSGTLRTTNDYALSTGTGNVIVSSGATLQLLAAASKTITSSGTILVGPGGSLTGSSLGAGALGITGASGTIASFTDTGSGSLSLGPVTMGGNATIGLTAGAGIFSTGAVAISGGNNLLNLSGVTSTGTTYTLLAGSSLTNTGTISLSGAAVGNATLMLGSSSTVGRTTYTFSSSGTALQLAVVGQQLNLSWTGSESSVWNYSAMNWQSSGTPYNFGFGDNATISTASAITVDAAGVSAGAVVVNNASGTTTLGGGQLTASSFSMSGAGSIIASGSLSVGSGGLTVSNGSLTSTSRLAVTGGGITITGGTLRVDGAGNLNSGTFSGALVNNASFIYSGTGNQTLNGVISGTGVMTQAGSGLLSLTGTAMNPGALAIAAGSSLQLGGAGVLGSGSYAGAIVTDGTFAYTTSANQTLSGPISGSGTLYVASLVNNLSILSSGTLTISGNNTYTGGTVIPVATVKLGSATALGSASGQTTVSGSGVLDLNGQSVFGQPLTLSGYGPANGGGLINSNTVATAGWSGDVTIPSLAGLGGDGNMTISGGIGGAGGLTKWGQGTATLAGVTSYNGDTSIQNGTLRFQNPTVRTAGVLANNNTTGNVATLDLATSGSYAMDSLLLGWLLKVTHSGSGSASMSFAGGTVNGNVNKTLEVGANTTVAFNGGFSLQGSSTASRIMTLQGAGTSVFNGSISGESAVYPALVFGVTITGTSGDSTGTTLFNAANTYNGVTTVSGGTLKLGNADALGQTSAGTVLTTATYAGGTTAGRLDLNGQQIVNGENLIINGTRAAVFLVNSNTAADACWCGGIAVSGTASIGGAGNLALTGSIGNLSGGGVLRKAGVGTLTLSGSNPFSGPVFIDGGTLKVDNAAALSASQVTPLAGGTLALSPYLQVTLGGLAPLAGGLTDVGSGMVTVAGGLSAVDMVTALVTGLGDGSWNGTSGITSSVAATSGGDRTVGWLDNGDGTVTFAFAAAGDTNLDWQVDILDAANFLAGGKFDTGSPASWNQGDFTYDGIVDILDAASFLSTGLFDAGVYNPPPTLAGGIAAVPEPNLTVLGSAAFAAALLICNGRRHRES